ncbi:MAG: PadR family transcriptional regulator [Asgard group archaeon]|nr:PadR family transcriptional regulator [Asgard group archaeon]
MHRPPPFWRFDHFRPALPFGPHMVKELSQLVFLWTISEEPEGITGYDLQKNYGTKQTNVYRTLKEMEDEELIIAEETISKGRAQKLYKITEKGKEYLTALRQNWTNKIAFLTDIVPLEQEAPPYAFRRHHPPPMIEKIYSFESKEEAINYLTYIKSHYQVRKDRVAKRIERIKKTIESIDVAIDEITKLDAYDPKKAEEIVEDILKREK